MALCLRVRLLGTFRGRPRKVIGLNGPFKEVIGERMFALLSPGHRFISVNWVVMRRVIKGHDAIGFFSFQANLAGTGQILLAEC